MQQVTRNLLSIILTATVLCTAGCSRQSNQKDDIPLVDKIYTQATDALDAGDNDLAIKLIKKALDGNDLDEHDKTTLFPRFIGILLSINEAGQAEEEYLKSASDQPDWARAAFSRLPDHYRASGDTGALIAWYSGIIKSSLPADLKEQALHGLVPALYADNQLDTALAKIKENLHVLSENAIDGVMQKLLYQAIDQNNTIDADKILTDCRNMKPDSASVKKMCDIAAVNIAALKDSWIETMSLFKSSAQLLDDHSIDNLIRRLDGVASKQNRTGEMDAIFKYVLTGTDNAERSKRTAAGKWIARAKNNSVELIFRFNILSSTTVPVNEQFRLLDNNFYSIIQSTDRKCILGAYELSESMRGRLTDESSLKRLAILQLDATFMLQDYQKTLALIEKGIPDMEETWHKSAIAKLKAHNALENKQYEDAIKYFTEFITYTETQEKPEIDPMTGVKHTREMIIGRNLKRIGDIYRLLPNLQKAGESYEKALAYYAVAAGEVADDINSLKLVNEEVKDLQESLDSASALLGN